MMISKYPVGAKWEATNDCGEMGQIWLEERFFTFEVWRWSKCYADGSGQQFDWGLSFRSCRNEIPLFNRLSQKPIRFKRVIREE